MEHQTTLNFLTSQRHRFIRTARITTSIFIAFCPLLTAADNILLTGGDRLSGHIDEIDADGNVTLTTPLAVAPLIIRSTSVSSITFDLPPQSAPAKQEEIQLTNGDKFSGSLSTLDESSATLDTAFSGSLLIPKTSIKSILFQYTPTLYIGPKTSDQWDSNVNFSTSGNKLTARGKALLAKDFNLPKNFTFKYRVSWKSTHPKFSLHFCNPAAAIPNAKNIQDGYSLDFTTSNITLTRSSATQAKASLALIPIQLKDKSDAHLDVEIHVNRHLKNITLYLDGLKIDTFTDPSFTVPRGTFITFASAMSLTGNNLSITDIQLDQWNGAPLDDLDQPVDKLTQDLLITDIGEHYSGSIIGISKDPYRLLFQNKFSPELFPVPRSMIQSIHFASRETSSIPNDARLKITLTNGGSLTVSSLSYNADGVHVRHPVLGELKLKKSSLKQLHTLKKINE